MHKILIALFIFLFTISQTFAYAIKVYDEYGNRVGTYRKEGDSYQLYDFNDKKVDNPETLIKNPPDKQTLTEYTRTFYDENNLPIGTWRSGLYGNDGRYYPRGVFYPAAFYNMPSHYIVRPNQYNNFDIQNKPSTHFVDTKYPRMHYSQHKSLF